MTLKELYRIRPLRAEVKRLEKIIREKAESIGLQSPDLSGMPHGSGNNNTSKTEKCAIEITEYLDTKRQKEAIIAKLEKYIADIEDDATRIIFQLRFEDGYSWKAVADEIGGKNTEDSVKMACYRYVEKHG